MEKPPSLRWHLFGTLAVVIVLLAACAFSGGAIAQEVVDRSDDYTILLWLDEGLLQRSGVGRHYRNLFRADADSLREATEGFSPAEQAESIRVFDLWMPDLRKLRSGEGDSARITAEQTDAVIARTDTPNAAASTCAPTSAGRWSGCSSSSSPA